MVIRLLGCVLLLEMGPAVLAAQSALDHVAMGTAALQAHDLRTGLAHYEAALAADSTSYEANWRAAMAVLDLGQEIPDSVKSPERDSLYARAEILARRASRSARAYSESRSGLFTLSGISCPRSSTAIAARQLAS